MRQQNCLDSKLFQDEHLHIEQLVCCIKVAAKCESGAINNKTIAQMTKNEEENNRKEIYKTKKEMQKKKV